MSRPDLPPEVQVMLDWFLDASQADVLKALEAIEQARPREWSMRLFSKPVQRTFELGSPVSHYIPDRRSHGLLVAISPTATSPDRSIQYDLEGAGLLPVGFRDRIRETLLRDGRLPVGEEILRAVDDVIHRWLYATTENSAYLHFQHTLRRLEPRVYGYRTGIQVEWTLHPFERWG